MGVSPKLEISVFGVFILRMLVCFEYALNPYTLNPKP